MTVLVIVCWFLLFIMIWSFDQKGSKNWPNILGKPSLSWFHGDDLIAIVVFIRKLFFCLVSSRPTWKLSWTWRSSVWISISSWPSSEQLSRYWQCTHVHFIYNLTIQYIHSYTHTSVYKRFQKHFIDTWLCQSVRFLRYYNTYFFLFQVDPGILQVVLEALLSPALRAHLQALIQVWYDIAL